MGLVPCMSLRYIYRTSRTAFNREVPCMSLGGLWDQSHAWLSYKYGTGPMSSFVRRMGLFKISKIMISPILYSLQPMGPVPYMTAVMGLHHDNLSMKSHIWL